MMRSQCQGPVRLEQGRGSCLLLEQMGWCLSWTDAVMELNIRLADTMTKTRCFPRFSILCISYAVVWLKLEPNVKRVNIRNAVVFANNAAERTMLHVLPISASVDSHLPIGGKHRSLFNRLSVCLSISLCE